MPASSFQHLLTRLPLAGHSLIEVVVERVARRGAYGAGRAVARILRVLARRTDPRVVADAFANGVHDGEPPEVPAGRVVPFPRR